MESLVAVTTRVVPVDSAGACVGCSLSAAGWGGAEGRSFSFGGEADFFVCGDDLCRFAGAFGFFCVPDAAEAGGSAPFSPCFAGPCSVFFGGAAFWAGLGCFFFS